MNPAAGVSRTPQPADEPPEVHAVVVTRASSSSSRILNHESIPRATLRSRAQDRDAKPPVLGGSIEQAPTAILRRTATVLPNSPQLFERLDIPQGIVVRPLAPTAAPVPLVNFADVGEKCPMVRCRRCKAYINPFNRFVDGGRRYQCALCHAINEVPAPYFAATDPQTGARVDAAGRPELRSAVCDFVAPVDYMSRPPQRPTVVYCLDVSRQAVQSGMLAAQCRGIAAGLRELDADASMAASKSEGGRPLEDHPADSLQVGIIAFDGHVHFFSLKPTLSMPRMLVAADLVTEESVISEATGLLKSVQLPAPLADLVVPARESLALLLDLLERLPAMFAKTANVEVAFGPALAAAVTLASPSGGKVVACLGAAPSVGEGRLPRRDEQGVMGQPKEHTLAQPATEFYKQRALAASQAHISVDLFVSGREELDLASLAPLATLTAGHIRRVTQYDIGTLHRDVKRTLTRDMAYEAVLRIRTPPQLGAINFFGHFYVRGNDLLTLPVCDEDQSFTVQLNLQQPLNGAVYIQAALLYTTRTRERRIRVITAPFESSASLPRCYNSMNANTCAAVAVRLAVDQAVTKPFQQVQTTLADRLAKAMRMFRTYSATIARQAGAPGNALLLPAKLATLPQLLNGFSRLPACRYTAAVQTSPDERVASMAAVMSSPVESLVALLAPTIHCVFLGRRPPAQLPCQEACSVEAMRSDGVYLIDSGNRRTVFYGRNAPDVALMAFDVPARGAEGASPLLGSETATELTAADLEEVVVRFRKVLDALDRYAAPMHFVPLHCMAQGTGSKSGGAPPPGVPSESVIFQTLVEDELNQVTSYGSYLSWLQRRAAAAQ